VFVVPGKSVFAVLIPRGAGQVERPRDIGVGARERAVRGRLR
jgi:hypothetical protein